MRSFLVTIEGMTHNQLKLYRWLGISTALLVLLFQSTAQAEDNSAAKKAVDINLHYQHKTSDFDEAKLIKASEYKKIFYKLGVVNEEKNTSSSQEKALLDPYHRTVSTGLSF